MRYTQYLFVLSPQNKNIHRLLRDPIESGSKQQLNRELRQSVSSRSIDILLIKYVSRRQSLLRQRDVVDLIVYHIPRQYRSKNSFCSLLHIVEYYREIFLALHYNLSLAYIAKILYRQQYTLLGIVNIPRSVRASQTILE